MSSTCTRKHQERRPDPRPDLNLLKGCDFERLLEQQVQLREIVEALLRTYSVSIGDLAMQSIQRVGDSLAGIRAISDALPYPELAAEPALRVARAYLDFCRRQFRNAEADEEPVRLRRLTITDLAGSLLDSSQALWEMQAPALAPLVAAGVMTMTAPANVFAEANRQLAYLYRSDSDADPVEAFERCDAVATSTQGSTVVSLVYEINEIGASSGGADIFKPTNKNLRASGLLSSTIATDEESFAYIVDALYFLLYEGSGYAKRLTDKLSDENLEPLWLIKRLRSGFRHDLDHGDQRDVRRKRHQLGEDFVDLCGQARPAAAAAAAWRAAQGELLRRAVELLHLVLGATAGTDPSSV
ncbi:hypothetical protein KJ567_05540 [Candidatus Bipolaricaulota bacterium]|nr:hypothetical protein [Candidatus Bipolaricaulota bacterium]